MSKNDLRKPGERFLESGYPLPYPRPKPKDWLPKPDNEIIDEGTPGLGDVLIVGTIMTIVILVIAAMVASPPV